MNVSSHIFILMGVAASGKTTLGKALAEATSGNFFDGDDLHSASNLKKMIAGIPLTDADRENWLETIAKLITQRSLIPTPTFIACSALKQSYREILLTADPSLTFLFLSADPETLRKRITARHNSGEHFMPPSLLDSQLENLEPPTQGLVFDSTKPIPELVCQFLIKHQIHQSYPKNRHTEPLNP